MNTIEIVEGNTTLKFRIIQIHNNVSNEHISEYIDACALLSLRVVIVQQRTQTILDSEVFRYGVYIVEEISP